MVRISITSLDRTVRVPAARCRSFGRAVLAAEGVTQAQVSLVFLNDAAIHAINHRFLNHNEPTDVITFPLHAPGEALAGEIVLSVETAARVAREHGHDPVAEVLLYVLHGLLHLCGYDDLKPAPRRRMRARERWHLRQHGLHVAAVDGPTPRR